MTVPTQIPDLRLARIATGAVFFVNGLLFATWGVNVPHFKSLHALSDAAVSLALLAAGLGALAGVLRAGVLVDRYGARAVAVVAVGLSAAALALLLHLATFAAGIAALFVFGITASIADVAVNSHAVEVEAAMARPILSSCHGWFSLGGLAGAALGSVVAAMRVDPSLHMAGVAVVASLLTLVVVRRMLPDRRPVATARNAAAARFAIPPRALRLLGTMAALGFVTEGAMYDWSVLYLRETLGATQALAALAYASFSIAMAACRFRGDALRARWGTARLLRASGLLAAGSLIAIVVIGEPVAALLGFAFVGLAIANIVPVLFACASQVPGVSPAQGIAVVAGMGYVGFLGGPPLIGVVAQHAGLPVALGGSALFVAALALLAGRVAPAGER